MWIAIILLGFSGQLAWGVENQFFYMTHDREVEKMDFERLRALHRQLFESARH